MIRGVVVRGGWCRRAHVKSRKNASLVFGAASFSLHVSVIPFPDRVGGEHISPSSQPWLAAHEVQWRPLRPSGHSQPVNQYALLLARAGRAGK